MNSQIITPILKCCPYLYLTKNDEGNYSLFIIVPRYKGQTLLPASDETQESPIVLNEESKTGRIIYRLDDDDLDYSRVEYEHRRVEIKLEHIDVEGSPESSASSMNGTTTMPVATMPEAIEEPTFLADYSVEVMVITNNTTIRKFALSLEDSDDNLLADEIDGETASNRPYLYVVAHGLDFPYRKTFPKVIVPLSGFRFFGEKVEININENGSLIKMTLVADSGYGGIVAPPNINDHRIINMNQNGNPEIRVELTGQSNADGGDSEVAFFSVVGTKNADTF